jgi:hypothetical protein
MTGGFSGRRGTGVEAVMRSNDGGSARCAMVAAALPSGVAEAYGLVRRSVPSVCCRHLDGPAVASTQQPSTISQIQVSTCQMFA